MAARAHSLIFLSCIIANLNGATTVASALAKFESIERDRAAPGSRVTFSAAELTAYARVQAEVIAPGAVHNARLTISPGYADASAMIDFLHLPQVGAQPGWILRTLLEGQKPLHIRVRIQSRNGQARVDVESVEISGVVMEGRALEFLLSQFVMPSFPEARTGVWFELSHRIEQVQLGNGYARVLIRQ